MIKRRNFFNVQPGSVLFYWVVEQPLGCSTQSLEEILNGNLVQTFNKAQLADEVQFGPIQAGERLVLQLTLAFLAAGTVSIVATLLQPDGTVEARTLSFTEEIGAVDTAIVTVTA